MKQLPRARKTFEHVVLLTPRMTMTIEKRVAAETESKPPKEEKHK